MRKLKLISIVIVTGVGILIWSCGKPALCRERTVVGPEYWNAESFSSEAWRSREPTRRRGMFFDLITRRLAIGATIAEVESLLGPADSSGTEAGDTIWDYDIRDDHNPSRLLRLAFRPSDGRLSYVGTMGDDDRALSGDMCDHPDALVQEGQSWETVASTLGWPEHWELTPDGLCAEYEVGWSRGRTGFQFIVSMSSGRVLRTWFWNPWH